MAIPWTNTRAVWRAKEAMNQATGLLTEPPLRELAKGVANPTPEQQITAWMAAEILMLRARLRDALNGAKPRGVPRVRLG